jgi:hypothetical protein
LASFSSDVGLLALHFSFSSRASWLVGSAPSMHVDLEMRRSNSLPAYPRCAVAFTDALFGSKATFDGVWAEALGTKPLLVIGNPTNLTLAAAIMSAQQGAQHA